MVAGSPKTIQHTTFKKCKEAEFTNKEANIHINGRYKDGKRHNNFFF